MTEQREQGSQDRTYTFAEFLRAYDAEGLKPTPPGPSPRDLGRQMAEESLRPLRDVKGQR